jgi:2-polyprenyl-3-methyl-5-hydroxy-6-metoxy-1,4-benzoquinol methylase
VREPVSNADTDLLGDLRAVAAEAPPGYVPLQDIPYRGHHLLARAVLDATPPGGTVFEGGVSTGYFARLLSRRGLTVDGFELDPVAAEEARQVCREVWTGDLSTFDIDAVVADATYDTLVFGDTLEHLPDPPATLRRLAPKVVPGGALVLSIPNVANLGIRLSLLVGRFAYRDRGILDRTHLRFYTKDTLVDMVSSAGFEVTSVVGSVPVPGLTSPTACRVVHRLGNLRSSVFGYTFILTARRR